MEKEFGTLRKIAFGGFNPKDVVDCIEKTRNELYEYKTSAEKNIEELKEKIEKLESEKAALEKVNADLAKANAELIENAKVEEKVEEEAEISGDSLTVIEINAATSELKKVADDLCNSLRDFMDRIAENSISVVVENSENKAQEEFSAESFMAQLEAEIYAKLGVEADNDEVTVEVYTEEAKVEEKAEEEAVVCNKVSDILSQTESFTFATEKEEIKEEKEDKKEEASSKKNIFDFLKGASFLR